MRPGLRNAFVNRLNDYLVKGENPLTDYQHNTLVDVLEGVDDGRDFGYVKRPTGTGKTVTFSAIIDALNPRETVMDYPALVLSPRRLLAEQVIDNCLIRPDLYGYDPQWAGVYHSGVSTLQKRSALNAPVLSTTYGSFLSLYSRGLLDPNDYPLVILDEVHRARGDVIRPAIQEAFFGNSLVLGWTATDQFITGQTIGDHLFHGQSPMHETSVRSAVYNGETCPIINIVVETHISTGVPYSSNKEFSARDLERIARIRKRDKISIEMHANYVHPETKTRFRDLDAVYYCMGIGHAERVGRDLKKVFGPQAVRVVSGTTPKGELRDILAAQNRGEIKAIVNADLLIEGWDSPDTALCFMLRPTRAPILAEQTGGRLLRKSQKNPNKIAFVVTLVDDDQPDCVTFGQVADGHFLVPPGVNIYETAEEGIGEISLGGRDHSTRLASTDAAVKGVKVHASKKALITFKQRHETGQVKKKNFDMLTRSEIADSLGIYRQNRKFIKLISKLQEQFDKESRVPLIFEGKEIECGYSLGTEVGRGVQFYVHRKNLEDIAAILETTQIPIITKEWMSKSLLAQKIRAASRVGTDYRELVSDLERQFEKNPNNIQLGEHKVRCAYRRQSSSRTSKLVFCIHSNSLDVIREALGRVPANPHDLDKRLVSNRLPAITYSDSNFNLLFEQIKEEYDKRHLVTKHLDAVVINGERVRCGYRLFQLDRGLPRFCIHADDISFFRSKLNIPEVRAEYDLTRAEMAVQLALPASKREEFKLLWDKLEKNCHSDPKAPVSIDGKTIRCALKLTPGHPPRKAFYIHQSQIPTLRKKLNIEHRAGLKAREPGDVGKVKLAKSLGMSAMKLAFIEIFEDLSNASQDSEESFVILGGERIKCGHRIGGGQGTQNGIFCVHQSSIPALKRVFKKREESFGSKTKKEVTTDSMKKKVTQKRKREGR